MKRDAREQFLAHDMPFEPVHLPPLGFFGSPDDAAWAAVFLASEAGRFITGTTLHVDGGHPRRRGVAPAELRRAPSEAHADLSGAGLSGAGLSGAGSGARRRSRVGTQAAQ